MFEIFWFFCIHLNHIRLTCDIRTFFNIYLQEKYLKVFAFKFISFFIENNDLNAIDYTRSMDGLLERFNMRIYRQIKDSELSCLTKRSWRISEKSFSKEKYAAFKPIWWTFSKFALVVNDFPYEEEIQQ